MIDFENYERLTVKNIGKHTQIKDSVSMTDCLKRLAELEELIENGTLAELPCKVGDTAMAIIDTLAYDNSLQRVKIEGLAYIVKDENGDITFQHINRLFSNEAEAEARLKELNNSYKETGEF